MKPLFCCAVLLFSIASIYAQESTAQRRHAMATNHLMRVAAELSARCLEDISSLDDWKKRRPELRRQLLDMLGLNPVPRKTSLNAKRSLLSKMEKYTFERVVFESLPGLYVTGHLYLPLNPSAPRATILYLCGHAPHPLGAKVNYADRAAWFAENGFACFILDTLEFGEIPGIHHGLHDLNMWNWLSLGYTPAGTEVWNAVRAIDYLETRREVDTKQLGVTGISGGGAITWYLAAVDERVQAAAPVCSTYTFGSQAKHWRAWGQCDCIYFHNAHGWDFPMVAALIAPRPLLMISGRKDGDFPPDGYNEVFRRSKKVYDLYAEGDSDRVREFDLDVGHTDAPEFLREARMWMKRWLQNDTNDVPVGDVAQLPYFSRARAGAPRGTRNFRIHNELTQPVTLKTPRNAKAWEKRRGELLKELDARVFTAMPKTNAPFETRVLRNDGGWVSRYADYKDVTFQTESGIRVRAQLLSPRESLTRPPLLVYVKRPGDSIYFMDFDELLPVIGRYTVLILNPRFTETSISASEYRDIQMTSAWTGRTIAGMQLWDINAALRWAVEEEKMDVPFIAIYAKGEMGILGIYAALEQPLVKLVVLNDPPGSHWQGPALLNVLRVTDVAEVAAAYAPRRLVSLTKLPESFDFTRAVYGFHKAKENIKIEKSLPDALEVWR